MFHDAVEHNRAEDSPFQAISLFQRRDASQVVHKCCHCLTGVSHIGSTLDGAVDKPHSLHVHLDHNALGEELE